MTTNDNVSSCNNQQNLPMYGGANHNRFLYKNNMFVTNFQTICYYYGEIAYKREIFEKTDIIEN